MEPFTVEHFRVWALGLELDNGEPWQVDGWFLAAAGDYFAGIPENWWVVPEGNAKTTNTAGFALYLLEHRSRAAIPWAASTREQAEIGYRQAEGFVLSSARLKAKFKCQEGYRRIKNLESGGRIQVFAADDAHADGIIPTDAFLDELHRHKNLRLYRTWRGKLLKRGGQMATITTAGEAGSEFEETRTRIRQETPIVESREGFTLCRSEHIALHEYAVPEGGDVDDMRLVKAANPFSGITVEALALKRATPTMTPQHWARFVCNLATRESSAAIQEREWHDAATAEPAPDGFGDWWVGIDVGWRWDTTALVPLAWLADDHRRFGPAVVLEPPRDGSSMHPDSIKRAWDDLAARYRVTTAVMDTNRAEDIAAWLSDRGVHVVDRAQTNKPQAEDFERFMEALRQGWIRHSGDEGLRRHALNAVARLLPDGGARFDRPSSSRSGPKQDMRVVDALTAAAMVHSVRCEWEPPRPRRSAGFR